MIRLSTEARNAIGNQLNDLLDNGVLKSASYLEIRSGSRPTSPDFPATGTLLATITLPASGFGTFTAGKASIPALTASQVIVNDGLAGYFRAYNRDNTPIMDGIVGLANTGADLVFDRVDFVAGGSIAISNFTLTIPTEC